MEIDKKQLSKLVLKYQAGDGKAFEQIYNLTNKSAYFTALKITKNEEDAKDVLQEAYVKLLDTINKLEKPESFVSWFNMIVANKAKDFMRKNNPNLFTDNVIKGDGEEEYSVFDTIAEDNEEFIPGAGIEQTELQRDVMALVDGLSDEKRTAVLLYYYNGMTTRQIATSLRVNENTVKSRLVQARKDLAKSVKELEKKNGKLLGVAPIPVVIWALKGASVQAAATFHASGIAASIYASITAAKPFAGAKASSAAVTNVAAKSTTDFTAVTANTASVATSTSSIATVGSMVAGLTLAQKLAIIFAIISLIIGGSVTAKIVTDKKDAKETTAVTEEYISKDDAATKLFDDEPSEITESTEEASTEAEMRVDNYPMDEEKVKSNFNGFNDLYEEWLDFYNVESKHTDESGTIELPDYETGYLIDDPSLTSIDDIKAKFSDYCTDELYDKLPSGCTYRTINGRLYLIGEATECYSCAFTLESIKKESDTKYIIKTLFVEGYTGEPDISNYDWTYEFTQDKGWILTDFKETYVWVYDNNSTGSSVVTTSGSDLNVREYPSVNAKVVARAKNGQQVYSGFSSDDWAYIEYESGNNWYNGWVKREYLTPYYGEQF